MSDQAPGSFNAEDYWSRRLAGHWGLHGTGHLSYSAAYNAWLYRGKSRVLGKALRRVQPGRAFDVGSGVGWVVELLRRRGWQVEGCDLTDVAVTRLREQFPGVPFEVVDAGRDQLPLSDSSTDLVTVIDVVYHLVADEQFQHLLGEIARVLKRGGTALVTDTLGERDVRPAEHVHFRPRGSWNAALASHPLTIVDQLPYFKTLSRLPEDARWLRHLPDGVRGAVEYTADALLPLRPHMRLAVLRRA